jgi:apolipoprotein N-acyltransferase
LWFLADEARGHVFGGFPWNLIGYAWSGVLPVLQSTSVIGIYGLTLLTIVAAALPASLTTKTKAARIVCACGIALFVLLAMGGEARLLTTPIADVPDVRLRIVQPNTDQAHKWLMTERENDFQQLLDMTSAPADQPITHVIWPETASTYYLSEDNFHRAEIGQHIPAAGAVITGVIRRSLDQTGKTQFFNSLVAVDGLGRLVAGYDKVHLVPFGEFMPLRKYNPIPAVAVDTADFTPGDSARSLRVLGLPPFSPLICYESVFTGDVIDQTDRPEWILNVTNDAWYGQTIGPYQHFAIARVRAIEEGLPLVRAANTGISGVIDPLGRIKTKLSLGKRGVIDSNLPASLESTPFERLGDLPVFMITITLIVIRFLFRRHKYKKTTC